MVKNLLIISLFLALATPLTAQIPNNPIREEGLGISPESGEKESLKLFIPNAFTPNDDGVNDFFYINNAFFSTFNFIVFDRWGNQVFQTNNASFRWDGKINGKPVPSDIYVFVFQGTTQDNLDIKRSGTISVVR